MDQPDLNDQPLSEDELEAVYGQNASPVPLPSNGEPPVQRRVPVLRGDARGRQPSTPAIVELATVQPGDHAAASARKSVAKPPRPRRTIPQDNFSLAARSSPAKPQGVQKTSRRAAKVGGAQKQAREPLERLAANELVLVRKNSPHAAPSSSTPAHTPCEQQWPAGLTEISCIDDSSSPLQESKPELRKAKASLTSLRRRLKSTRFTHKSVIALRKKHEARAPFFKGATRLCNAGDGFERSELKDTHQPPIHRRRTQRPLALNFAALSLKSGPLPDVEFNSEPNLETQREQGTVTGSDRQITGLQTVPSILSPDQQPDQDAFSFSDRVLDEMAMQRLSCISAPKKAISISSDHDEDEADWDESEPDEQDLGQIFDTSPRHTMSPTRQTGNQQERRLSEIPSEPPVRTGVTLDFRKPASLGVPLAKQHLMEVDEAILDVPDENDHDGRAMTQDFSADFLATQPQFEKQRQSQASACRKEARSPNHRQRTMIDLDSNDGYFSTASNMLRDPTSGRPRILKHRSSQLRRSYLARQDEIQVPDSNDYVPETDLFVPETSLGLGTSSLGLPKAPKPKDLRGLTKAVSRDAGTLSQSVRRRPTLPFNSPTKLR